MEFGFFLKKLITFFVEPFGMVFTLFIIGLFFLFIKKDTKARTFLLLAFGLLFLFSYPPFANYLIENLENQYPKYKYKEEVQYIHVLGNGHNTDITQPISSHVSDGGTKRVLEGVIIHRKIKDSIIIFTGYEGDTNTSNAQMNAALASAIGVEKNNMVVFGLPKDTKEEALFAKDLVGERPFVLVTSATHMPRAMKIFKNVGLNPIAAPTDFHKDEFSGYLRAPSASYFQLSKIAVHEYIGSLWEKIRA